MTMHKNGSPGDVFFHIRLHIKIGLPLLTFYANALTFGAHKKSQQEKLKKIFITYISLYFIVQFQFLFCWLISLVVLSTSGKWTTA